MSFSPVVLRSLFVRASEIPFSTLSQFPLFYALGQYARHPDLIDDMKPEYYRCVEAVLPFSQPNGLSSLVDRISHNREMLVDMPKSLKTSFAQRIGETMSTFRLEGQGVSKPEHAEQLTITQMDLRKLFFALPRIGINFDLWRTCGSIMNPLIEGRLPDPTPMIWPAAMACATRCSQGHQLRKGELLLFRYFWDKKAIDVLLQLEVRGVVLLVQSLKDMRSNDFFRQQDIQAALEIVLARLRHSVHEMNTTDCITVLYACFRARMWDASADAQFVIDGLVDKALQFLEPARSPSLLARLCAVLFSPIINESERTDRWRLELVARLLLIRTKLNINDAVTCLWQLRSAGMYVRRCLNHDEIRAWVREVAQDRLRRETNLTDASRPVDPKHIYEVCQHYIPKEPLTAEIRRIVKRTRSSVTLESFSEFDGVAEEDLRHSSSSKRRVSTDGRHSFQTAQTARLPTMLEATSNQLVEEAGEEFKEGMDEEIKEGA